MRDWITSELNFIWPISFNSSVGVIMLIRILKDSSFGSCAFTGGREDTPEVRIVKSNYHSKEPKEIQVAIQQGPDQTELVPV